MPTSTAALAFPVATVLTVITTGVVVRVRGCVGVLVLVAESVNTKLYIAYFDCEYFHVALYHVIDMQLNT